jgi:Asp-tRNA(Asn)/Glu-tRNA(Gln) amidotransferase A subunit family amidase
VNDLEWMDATELVEQFRARELSPVEVTTRILERIDRYDGAVNSFVTVVADQALAQARDAERRYLSGDVGPADALLGVPMTVKDLEDTRGVRTTYGSVDFADNVPDSDGLMWGRLRAAGATLLGKTTTPELGASGVTESQLSGITRNPWALDRTAGGSSGGAAVAVAMGFGPIANGSDGGGSIRVPASVCGVVGLKPTLGRIPFNTRAYSYESVSTCGPLSRSVRDAALALTLSHGPHRYDPLCLLESGVDFTAATRDASIRGLRVAYSPDLGSGPVAADTAAVVRAAAQSFEADLGAVVSPIEISLPDPMQYFLDFWEPFIAHEQIEFIAGGGQIDDEVRERFPLVARALARSALDFAGTLSSTRTRIHSAFADVFAEHDLLIWPTTPSTAFRHPAEAGYPEEIGGVALSQPGLDNQRLTEAISHAGFPAITVPAGWTKDGLPVGLQIAADRGRDDLVLQAAAAFEVARPWADRKPPIA